MELKDRSPTTANEINPVNNHMNSLLGDSALVKPSEKTTGPTHILIEVK